MMTSFSQFTPINVKEIVRKPQLRFREKSGKLKLRQSGGFLIKNLYIFVVAVFHSLH